ncbi:MAG: hypothetical protein A2Y40_07570 [Candidatus Margulisbacteria bacterium GWF2_35_9]|nr:MAG: hypothetical protein A2Y40_07570 [Candidatus Margulisbacteria bacterium GWF2_35_9]
MNNQKPILLIEDDQVDFLALKRCFEELNVQNPLVQAMDGEDAMSYLKDPANEKPFLILLDINMPKLNGLELLNIIKYDRKFKNIPVIILSTSSNKKDIDECFGFSVAGFFNKEMDYETYKKTIKTIIDYWMLSKNAN